MWQEWCIQMSLLKLWWPLEHSCSPTWKFWSASCTGARRKYRYLWSSAFCKRGGAWATVGPHFTDRDTDGAASIWKYLSNVLSHIVICTQDRQLHWLSTANVYQFSSVAQSCLALCDSMDYTMPGLMSITNSLELAQTLVHRVNDTTQTSHPLSSPSPPAFNLS